MPVRSLIPGLVISLITSCSTSKNLYRPYAEDDADKYYTLSEMNGELFKPGCCRPYVIVTCMGYRSTAPEVLNTSSGEDVKHEGIILSAKSILHDEQELKVLFGSGSFICSVRYQKRQNMVRHGRSALISVLNAVDAVKGKPFTPQDEPDTSYGPTEWTGSIEFNGNTSGFYYNRVPKNSWFILNGDTLRVKDAKNKVGEINNAPVYEHWIQLERNNTIYAAMGIRNSLPHLFILKALRKEDVLLIAAFYSVIVYDSKYAQALLFGNIR